MSDNLFERVYWVADGVGDDFSAHLPSRRYSAIIPAAELGGHVVAYDPATQTPDAFLARYRPGALIFTKAFDDRFLALADAARRAGIKTAATVIDWHFGDDYNMALFRAVDLLVVQTAEMAAVVGDIVGRSSAIIEEPYEGRRNPPRFRREIATGDEINLLWYGSNHNLDGLEIGLRQIAALTGHHFRLTVICEEAAGAQQVIGKLTETKSPLRCRIGNWSADIQEAAIEAADIILIPNALSPKKRVKGHNRLVAAIHGGRLALASPLPQYLELADYCWCGDDMADGIEWAVANAETIEGRIAAGQAHIDGRFAPAVVAGRWRAEIEALVGRGAAIKNKR